VRRATLILGVLGTVALLLAAACGGGGTSTSAPTTSTSAASTQPTTAIYDPYEGTSPATTATGSVVSGSLITGDGRTRTYRLYVPSSVDGRSPMPLLVALHGGLGSAAQFAANSGFEGLAESNRFIVVFPDGIGALADGTAARTWNGGYCCGAAARLEVDDVGFIRSLIDEVSRTHPVDPDRVVVSGHSNGAILAYRLACELSDRIVAIGVQAGSLGVDTCTPPQPVSVFHLHGTADANHPVEGGKGSGPSGVEFHSAQAAIDTMVAADGCASMPVDGVDPMNSAVHSTTWSSCRDGAAVRLVLVDGATHAWMGHPGQSPQAAALVGDPYPDLDASRAIWSFLAAHPRS